MKKLSFIIAVLVFAMSCVYVTPKPTKEERPELKLKVFLDKFLQDHPDWSENNIKIEEASTMLATSFLMQELGDSIPCISEIPMKFVAMHKNNRGKYIVHFWHMEYYSSLGTVEFNKNNSVISSEYSVYLSVFSVLDKEHASELKEGALYRLKGSCHSYRTPNSLILYGGQYSVNDMEPPSIQKKIAKDQPLFDMGRLFVSDLQYTLIE